MQPFPEPSPASPILVIHDNISIQSDDLKNSLQYNMTSEILLDPFSPLGSFSNGRSERPAERVFLDGQSHNIILSDGSSSSIAPSVADIAQGRDVSFNKISTEGLPEVSNLSNDIMVPSSGNPVESGKHEESSSLRIDKENSLAFYQSGVLNHIINEDVNDNVYRNEDKLIS